MTTWDDEKWDLLPNADSGSLIWNTDLIESRNMPRGVKRKEVVLNFSHDFFMLSDVAIERLSELKGRTVTSEDFATTRNVALGCRHDPDLIKVVKELGEKVNGNRADIRVVKIRGNRYSIVSEGDWGEHEYIETPEDKEWIEIEGGEE